MNVNIYKLIDRYLFFLLIFFLYPFRIFKKKPKEIKKIAIIRLWAIGESILTLPLIKRLKENNPEVEIEVICTNKNKLIFENQKFIDKINILGISTPFNIHKYDLAIDTEPFMNISGVLSFVLGKSSTGYNLKKTKKLYTHSIEYNDKIHAADNFLALSHPLKIDNSKIEKLVPINTSKYKNWSNDSIKKFHKPLIGVCLIPGKTARSRTWPFIRWIHLLNKLAEKYSATVVFIGSKEDKKTIKRIQEKINSKTINLSGLSLGKSIAIITKLDLMLSLDTGPMHIAAAQEVPTIGLFCPNSPIRFGPLGKNNDFIYNPVLDKPCINVHRGEIPECENHNHMKQIQVENVFNKIKEMEQTWNK